MTSAIKRTEKERIRGIAIEYTEKQCKREKPKDVVSLEIQKRMRNMSTDKLAERILGI